MTTEERLSRLEKLVHAFINQSNLKNFYDKCDKDGIRQTENENTSFLSEKIALGEEALCDVDEAYDSRIADVEEALCDLSEMMEG